MIVVCGELLDGAARGGYAVAVASRAAAAGAAVEAVGIVPDDPAGDRRLLRLGQAGVRHAAVLREPARPLDSADVDLALRYLPEVRVIVAVAPPPEVLSAVGEHASWSGAALVVLESSAGGGAVPSRDMPSDAIVLEAPASDPDLTFAGFVGAFVARLDRGSTPADAWAETTRDLAVERA